jgi:exodeoxyribonuclease V alpha subunit
MSENERPNPSPGIVEGVVERLTYHSAESGYTVARFKPPRASELITIVGTFPNIQPGQTLQLEGFWREHPKYGSQFQVSQYRETKPATLTGIEKYLGSGLIKGVGTATAKRIVAHFGLDTLDVIENHSDRLSEVPGISPKRILAIQEAWESQKSIKEVMLFLQGHGVSTTYAVKIYKQYGDESIATVSNNPYQLANDIYGIGFVTADAIARNLGFQPNSEFRYRSGILHVLTEAADDGHCFLPQLELVEAPHPARPSTQSRLYSSSDDPDGNRRAIGVRKKRRRNTLLRAPFLWRGIQACRTNAAFTQRTVNRRYAPRAKVDRSLH